MAGEKQVKIKLITALGKRYQVPQAVMAVPADVTRYGLSTVINHMLKLDTPLIFDIILEGELLRETLGAALLGRNLSTETTIVLEYVLLALPPNLEHSVPQKDWLRAIVCPSSAAICSASADGLVSVHSSSGVPQISRHAHEGGSISLAVLPGAVDELLDSCTMMSGGHDGVANIWGASPEEINHILRLEAHTDSVLATAATKTFAATGSSDSTVHLWNWPELTREAADSAHDAQEPTAKAVKGTGTANPGQGHASVNESSAILQGHSLAVTGLSWLGADTLLSASMDHSLKRWDINVGSSIDSISTGKALLCCTCKPALEGTSAIVVSGAMDGTVRWWDCRAGAKVQEALALKVFKAHSGPVTSVSWRIDSEFQVASSSLDGTVKLWDMRSPVSLSTINDCEGSKLSAVAWGKKKDRGLILVSGGQDSILRVYDAPHGDCLETEP